MRKYARRFHSQGRLALAELSYLLWCTQGVKKVEGGHVTLRTVTWAGARQTLETCLLVNNVEGLQPGLYRFLAMEHKLVEVNLQAGIADRITEACWQQRFVKTSAVTFYLGGCSIQDEVAGMVKEDTGICTWTQATLARICTWLLNPLAVGYAPLLPFSDEDMNRLLGIDGEEQFVIYIATVGKVLCDHDRHL